jgi:hypothetical protein
LGHSFDPKIWQNFGNFGLDSSVIYFFICADFLGKKTHHFFSVSQNWGRKSKSK